MSQTAADILKASTAGAELADRLIIAREQDAFRLELRGLSGHGVAGVVKREELQRILQMLQGVVAQAGWLAAPGGAGPAAAAAPADPKPARH
jgi:hypothetical protein